MTNLANWQDDIEALGGDFDGSLSGLCIMSLSFDFTRSGLANTSGGGVSVGVGGNGVNGASGLATSTGSATTIPGPSHSSGVGQIKSTPLDNNNSSMSEATSLAITNHNYNQANSFITNNRLSSTSALSLHHHHHHHHQYQHQYHHDTLKENDMNAFKRFKSSLIMGSPSTSDQNIVAKSNKISKHSEEDIDQSEEPKRDLQQVDDLRLMIDSKSSNLNGNNNQQIVLQLQNQIKNRSIGATLLTTNSMIPNSSYPNISNLQTAQSPTERNQNHKNPTSHDEEEACSSIADRSPPPPSSVPDDDSLSMHHSVSETDDEDARLEDEDEDLIRSSPSSPRSSSMIEQDEDELNDEEDDSGSQSPSDMSINVNNMIQESSQDLRITANISPQTKSNNLNLHSAAGNRHRSRRQKRNVLNKRQKVDGGDNVDDDDDNEDKATNDQQRKLSSFLAKDNLVNNGGTLKESSYTTSVITTTAPMHFKGLHHHHHHHHPYPHSFSMKHTFPPSPYHQFSNSSFNHDFYDRYLSHDSHQPLQTPLIGIERTQDLLSLKLPPHGLDTTETDSQRFTKEWLFGTNGQANASITTEDNQTKLNEQIQQTIGNRTMDEVNENKTLTNQRESPVANDLSLCNNNNNNAGQQQFDEAGKRRLFGSRQDQIQQRRDSDDSTSVRRKSFQFSYRSSSSTATANANSNTNTINNNQIDGQREPIDLNMSFEQNNNNNNDNDNDNNSNKDVEENKSNMFDESMKHFNPNRMLTNCFGNKQADDNANDHDQHHEHNNQTHNHNQHHANHHQHHNQADNNDTCQNNALNMSQQYHGQDSIYGFDQASKQKFQYILASPISVATKITEDTMTYLNQAQAYEIKLENITDVSEAKKGFMCSIVNIGFHERHMQQAENELWQQWSQQHPGERIFSVDMKLSYNVFGVESDGLNKYEFLWDSSKAAGVFIRINSISTEFTPRKHGGEKGIPFKLSIETFSYNSKTHDSYFISAACCQIKVFKPKGAERKIRSDRDKVFKRPPNELHKYHQSCDHTIFKECSLSSLHPLVADGSIGYYRHSHGHFASKQNNTPSTRCTPVTSGTSIVVNPTQTNRSSNHDEANNSEPDNQLNENANNHNNNSSKRTNESSLDSSNRRSQQHASDSDNSRSREYLNQSRTGPDEGPNSAVANRALSDYSTSRLLQSSGHSSISHYRTGSLDENGQQGSNYGQSYNGTSNDSELALPNSSCNMHHHNQQHSDVGDGPMQTNPLNQMYPHQHQHHHSTHHNQPTNAGVQRSVASLTGANHASQAFNISYYNQHHPPHSHQHQNINTQIAHPPLPHQNGQHNSSLSFSSSGVQGSAFGPAYQAAAVAAAVAVTRAPASIQRQLTIGEKSINNQAGLNPTTPFRATNLALASSNHQPINSSSGHCGDNSQSQHESHHKDLTTAHQHHNNQHSSLHSYHHQTDQHHHHQQHLNDSFDSNQHNQLDASNIHNQHHPAQSSSALPQLYRQRSASTSLTNTAAAHCSSYVGVNASGLAYHQHHHHATNGHSTQQRTQPAIGDCYNPSPVDNQAHAHANNNINGSTWSSTIQSNPNLCCLTRGCNSSTNCLNQNHNNSTYQSNTSNYFLQHLQAQHNHYEQHSEQDSPHKSHNSNDSPSSCYSRFRENLAVSQNENNNTMSSYSSQQQQQHPHQQSNNQTLEHQHQPTQDDQDQHQQLASLSRSSSSLFNHNERISIESNCAEVLNWLLNNRFGLFTKTFNNFSGADLLRLSKSELVEICGLPDGIRLFNSLHIQPIRTKRKTFRTLRFAQIKREMKMKRKLK